MKFKLALNKFSRSFFPSDFSVFSVPSVEFHIKYGI
ncbi:hypothetical protein TherJR_1674 [Thermincola potens JR]|uniref:Uncharacterized protein n=1 Tax=Thermincola potens (strain JR) TaxID=635013 RepID=D5X7F3_THEPJ|nr:hypothetical protein TherJR_1674 [Thermincola potens JR]